MGTFTNRQSNIGDSSHIFNKVYLTTLSDGTNEINVADIANKNNPFQEWVADTEYEVDNVVLYNNIIYKCITENADSEFDETNWDIIGGTGSGDGIYISVSKWKYDTNGRLVPITEQEKEQEYEEATEAISDKVADNFRNNPFNNWVSSTEYSVGDVVLHDNKIYQCTIANSDTEFTESNWISIGGGAGVIVLTQAQYDALTDDEKNDDVIYVITNAVADPEDETEYTTKEYVDTALQNKANASDLDDYLPLSGGTMTGPIITSSGEDYIPVPKTAQAHNGIYRGKDFGTISSVAQLETFLAEHDVSTGKFTDLYIGDYFLLQDGTYNKAWEIAGFDWYINKGDTALTTHHLALIPKENLTDAQMNATNTTVGAYYNSYMHQTVIPQVNTHLATVLGTHLLERKALLSNTMDASAKSNAYSGWSGCSSGWAWYAVKACLMSEVAMYEFEACGNMFDAGEDCVRLPIFNFKEYVTNNRQNFWLRAVANSTNFAVADSYGDAASIGASTSVGVRPLICVG